MTGVLRAAAIAMALSGAAHAVVPEPQQFRMDHYRDEVPATLQGATVVTTASLARLIMTQHPVLIDVLPSPAPPPDARPGFPRLPVPHTDIPGSVWLPDTGRGSLSPALDATFKARLAALTGNNRARPIVFYCLSRCWMSWNAARRAVLYGYTNVIWYPDGADGWQRSGRPTVVNTPEP